MGIQDIVALAVAGAAAFYAVRFVMRSLSGRSNCGCGEGQTCGDGERASADDRTGVRRRPMVPPDQIGRPPVARHDTSR